MSRSTSPNQGQDPKDMDRMLDLLADQALEGLTAAEAAELAPEDPYVRLGQASGRLCAIGSTSSSTAMSWAESRSIRSA